jgi:hypothetical protein
MLLNQHRYQQAILLIELAALFLAHQSPKAAEPSNSNAQWL